MSHLHPRRYGAALTAAVLLLAACGGADVPAEPTVVDAWFHGGEGAERDTFEQQVRAFNAASEGVQIELRLQPSADYDALVSSAADAGTLPCVLDFDGPFLTAYAEAELLRPLTELLSDDVTRDLLPSIVEQGTYRDAFYGVGTFDSGLGLWGNRAYLDRAGVRVPDGVEDAWSFEEFEAALTALSALPEVEHVLDLKANYGVGEWLTYGFSPVVWGFGGDILATDDAGTETVLLDSPETVEALTWYASLFERGFAVADDEQDDAFYGARTAALAWVGHWMWEPHRDGLGDDLVLLPLPAMPQGAVTGLGSWQWGITSTCDAPQAAASFLDFLLSEEEIARMTGANGAVPARTSAITASTLYGVDGPLRVFADQLTAGIGRRRPVTPHYADVTATFAELLDQVRDGADVTTSVRAAATQMRAEIDP